MTAIDHAKALIFTGGTIPTSGASAADLAVEIGDRASADTAVLRNAGLVTLANVTGTGNAITAEFPAALVAIMGGGIPSNLIIGFVSPVTTTGAATLTIGADTADIRQESGSAMTAEINLKSGRFCSLRRHGTQWRMAFGDVSYKDLIDQVELEADRAVAEETKIGGEASAALRNAIDNERDTGQDAQNRVVAESPDAVLISHKPGNAELDMKLSPRSAQIAARAGADDRGLFGGRLPLTVAGDGVVESMGSDGSVRWDNPLRDPERDLVRGRYVKTVSNGRVVEALTPQGGVVSAGSTGAADAQGRHSFFQAETYAGFTLKGAVYHTVGGVSIRMPPSGKLLMVLGLGQSWGAQNGQNGRLARFSTALTSGTVMMFNDSGGTVVGSPTTFDPAQITGFEDYFEKSGNYQTVMGPTILQFSRMREMAGMDGLVLGRSCGSDMTSLADLGPGTPSYNKLEGTIDRGVALAAAYGLETEVIALTVDHGAADMNLAYEVYKQQLFDYVTAVQDSVVARTGQAFRPMVFIRQPPGFDYRGDWPCLKAQVDLCHEKPDWHLVLAGWAYPQRDFTHYLNESTLIVGRASATALIAAALNRPVISPYAYEAMRGVDEDTGECFIDLPVEGSFDLYIPSDDELPHTERHGIIDAEGGWTRIPNEGFEFLPSGTAATITGVRMLTPRTIRVTLSANVPGRLTHAWHNGGEYRLRTNPSDGSVYRNNESCNRGTIRARPECLTMFGAEGTEYTADYWLASNYWDV